MELLDAIAECDEILQELKQNHPEISQLKLTAIYAALMTKRLDI